MNDWTSDDNGHTNSSDLYRQIVADVERIIRNGAHNLIAGHADVTARSIVSHLAHRRRFIPMTVPGAFGATVTELTGGGLVNLLVDRDTDSYPDDGAHVLVLPFPEDS